MAGQERLELNPAMNRYWIEVYLRNAQEWLDRAIKRMAEHPDA